jgi:hypothetical protein
MAQGIVTRVDRAAGIVSSGGVIEMAAGGYVVIDQGTGSGKGHITTTSSCDCPDHLYRGRVCKHMIAVRKANGVVCCPKCGAATVAEQYYIGGRGYVWFRDCTADKYHYSVRAD